MKPLTIEKLYKCCEYQIKEGNGNKIIMISDDDEGNGFHYLWYAFIEAKEIGIADDYIDKEIAGLEDTMILG